MKHRLSPMQQQFVAAASRPHGVASTDTDTGLTAQQIRSLVSTMRVKGLLHTYRLSHKVARHFATAEGLADYITRRGGVAPIPQRLRQAVTYMEPSQQLRREAAVIVPVDIKVQRCPAPVDTRFAPAPGYVGEFSRQWAEKRSPA